MRIQQHSDLADNKSGTLQVNFKSRKKSKHKNKAYITELLFYVSIVILPMLQLLIYYVYVNFDALLLSFRQWDAVSDTFSWVGLENYKRVIFDLKIDGSWLNVSFELSCLTWLINKLFIFLPIIFAFYAYKHMPGWKFFKAMLYLPSIISGMVISLLVQYLFNNAIPEIALKYFGTSIYPMLQPGGMRAYWTHYWWSGFFNCGAGILLYSTVMSRIPKSLSEYAYLEGCGPLREFFIIVMPLIMGTFVVTLVGGVASIFSDIGPWFTYFGANSTSPSSIGYYIYSWTVSSSGYENFPYASACGMFFSLFAIPLTLIMRWVMDKLDPKVQY